MTTRVFEYGCRPPVEGAAEIDRQISLAHKYQHKLVELERERRAAYRALISAHPDQAPLEAERERLVAELRTAQGTIKAERQAKRKRTKVPEGVAADIIRIRGDLAEVKLKIFANRQAMREDKNLQTALKQVNEAAYQKIRDARAVCGVFWGSYLLVEEAVDRARKERADPKFRRWDGAGHLGVQIQKGMDVDDVFKGADTRLRIDPVPEEAFSHPSRAERRRLSRTTVHFRIGSADPGGRTPVWAVLPMVMHRPLPKGRIKWAHLVRKPLANKFEWRLQIIVDMDAGVPPRPRTTSHARVGVDIGWRKTDEGIRVAYAVDDAGKSREYILPDDIIEKLDHADSLRSIRDRNLDEVKERFKSWMDTNSGAIPDWMRERTSHMSQWRSCARMAALSSAWREKRWEGDQPGFELVEAWRKQDKHLWTWEVNERQKTMGWRLNVYRNWAADLATRYGTVVMEKFDLRPMARRAAVDGQESLHAPQRRQRFLAALSVLRNAIEQAVAARGGVIELVDAQHTTTCCHACGHTEAFDAAASIMRICPRCGVEWDQDDNAGRNLLTLDATGELPPEVGLGASPIA